MSQLQPPDSHHLSAAEGWLGLGNHCEAQVELDHISASEQEHIEVLALRWSIEAHFKSWGKCASLGARMVELAPKHVFGWIHRSFALHELKRTQEARDLLLPAVKSFPKNETIPYNLACYECQIGNLESARGWLKKAMAKSDPRELKHQALTDLDLEPLWAEIANRAS